MTIVVNHSWQGQRTTGQQRYAQEIASRLVKEPDVVARPATARDSRILAWLSAQTLAVPRGRQEWLLTLTSRGPLWHSKHVLTIHDHFVLTNPEWYSRKYVATHAPVLKAQLAGARGIVFVSRTTQQRHWELFGDATPSVVAPNGVEPSSGQHVAGSIQIDRPFLLAVGSKDPRKNIGRLVQAYEALPDKLRSNCSLVLAGGADSAVFRQSQPLGGGGGIVVLDYVSDEDLWSLYHRAAALVAPSLDEGFGLPLVEAASMGTPLVVSDISVFRWIARESALYFDPRDVQSMSDALAGVVQDPSTLPPPPEVINRFDWGSSSQVVLDFVRRLQTQ